MADLRETSPEVRKDVRGGVQITLSSNDALELLVLLQVTGATQRGDTVTDRLWQRLKPHVVKKL